MTARQDFLKIMGWDKPIETKPKLPQRCPFCDKRMIDMNEGLICEHVVGKRFWCKHCRVGFHENFWTDAMRTKESGHWHKEKLNLWS